MKTYYLYGSGKMLGPITEEKLNQLRLQQHPLPYLWIIEESDGKWMPVEQSPNFNPFQSKNDALTTGSLSAAFTLANHPIIGQVQAYHRFGLQVWVAELGKHSDAYRIPKKPQKVILNMVDEKNQKWLVSEFHLESIERTAQGHSFTFSSQEKQ